MGPGDGTGPQTAVTGTGPAVPAPPATTTGASPRIWHFVITVVGVLALLGTCGLFSTLVVQDELAGRRAQAEPTPTGPPPRDISSREVDPEPLTVDEVLPSRRLVFNVDEGPYEVLGTQDSPDCTVAVADELATLLDGAGCSQVVRATLRSPSGDFLVTTGVFNLATQDEADRVYENIQPIITNQTGRFLGMLAGEGTDPIVLSQTQSGWDYRGHYLIYAVIARSDGGEFTPRDNKLADIIIWDLVEVHLRSGVLEERATASDDAVPVDTGEPSDDTDTDTDTGDDGPEDG